MAARLAVNVVVRGPDGGPRALLAGETVPDWAVGLIGEHCLAQNSQAVVASGGNPPPKSGRGSSADAWANYAQGNGVRVDLDAKREDLIAACEAAGVPTE